MSQGIAGCGGQHPEPEFPGGAAEIIVVDDCSADDTVEIISSEYPSVRLIRMERNRGHSAARNKGLDAAQGKYIAFLDSDDFWKPDYLCTQIASLDRNPGCIVLSSVEQPANRTVMVAQTPRPSFDVAAWYKQTPAPTAPTSSRSIPCGSTRDAAHDHSRSWPLACPPPSSDDEATL